MTKRNDERSSIHNKHTWEFAERLKNKIVISNRFVFRNKMNPNGTIQKRKTRLVTQGFLQISEVHFNETFSLSIATFNSQNKFHKNNYGRSDETQTQNENSPIRQHMSTAYLNGELKEEIFMEVQKFLKETLKCICLTKRTDHDTRRKTKKLIEKRTRKFSVTGDDYLRSHGLLLKESILRIQTDQESLEHETQCNAQRN